MSNQYVVTAFCPLNFIRGTIDRAPEGYGIHLESKPMSRAEALVKLIEWKQEVTAEGWRFSIIEHTADTARPTSPGARPSTP